MAAGDIFRCELHFENPSGPSSTGLYYREVAANTVTFDECRDIALAVHANIVDKVRAYLSDDWFFAAITVSKVFGNPRPIYELSGKDGAGLAAGLEPGPGLPANCAALFELQQETFGLRSHGRMFLPGIPEAKSNGNLLDVTYQTVTLNALGAFLELNPASAGDDGVWEPGVISAKIRDAALPAKDWAGAFAPLVNISPLGTIAIQRRRGSKIRGVSSTA